MESKEVDICLAILRDDLIAVKELLNYVDINSVNNKGDSLLMIAIISHHFDIAKHLLDKGANPSIFNNYLQTPLSYIKLITKFWEGVEHPEAEIFKEILELLEGKIEKI